MTHAFAISVRHLGHARRDHSEHVGLNLEIDVVGVQVVSGITGIGRQDALANVLQAGIVGMPDLPDFGVPLVRNRDRINIDSVAPQAVEK